jgi:uncharacterized protein (DUF433 family)
MPWQVRQWVRLKRSTGLVANWYSKSRQAGRVPLVKGTRIPADQIVEELELDSTIDEIGENYPSITRGQVTRLIAFR